MVVLAFLVGMIIIIGVVFSLLFLLFIIMDPYLLTDFLPFWVKEILMFIGNVLKFLFYIVLIVLVVLMATRWGYGVLNGLFGVPIPPFFV